MKSLLNVLIGAGALVLATGAIADDPRPVKRVPFNAQEAVIINPGPLQGYVVITTPLKSIETGAVIGECQTLVYGYTGADRVSGFSCFKK